MSLRKHSHPKLDLPALLVLLLCSAGQAFADEIPATMRPNWPELSLYPNDVPVWVAAKIAFDEDGRLVPSLFLDDARRRLERVFRNPKDPATGCTKMPWIYQDHINPPDRTSLASAVATSALVVWGKVVAAEAGFERGELGQLLMVQPLEVLKGQSSSPPAFFYVFVPKGRFRFAGHEICKEDPRVVEPEVGQELVLFPYHAPAGESFLNLEYDGSLIAFDAEGHTLWPQVMAPTEKNSQTIPNEESVLGEIRAYARKGR
jgi:hypothetical protein